MIQSSLDTDSNIIALNPAGSFISFLELVESAPSKLPENLRKWIEHQTPYQGETRYQMMVPKLLSGGSLLPTFSAYIRSLQLMDWVTEGFADPVTRSAFRRLMDCGLIEISKVGANEFESTVQISVIGRELIQTNRYRHYLASLSEVADFWQPSVHKVFRHGEAGIGTAFCIGAFHLITCRHVLDQWEIEDVVVEDRDGQEYKARKVSYHPDPGVDLAMIEVDRPLASKKMLVGERARLLASIATMGYPPVPRVMDSILLCSRGEVSGITDKLRGDCAPMTPFYSLILSTILRPGNSGGPVLGENGKVVGIVSKNLQEGLPPISEIKGPFEFDFNRVLGISAAISAEHLFEIPGFSEARD